MPVNVPRLLIGLIIAIYWARVMHLARKTKRRAGHSANVIPPTRWGRLTRAIWFPVIILWIVIPLIASVPLLRYIGGGSGWGFVRMAIIPLFDSPAVQVAALIVVLIGFVLTLICWRKMGRSWRMGIDPNEKTQLITTGPYARVRHPIYALSSLLMLATVLAVPSPLMLAVGAAHLTLLQLEAAREEKYLREIHGEAYVSYLHSTGRFLPRVF